MAAASIDILTLSVTATAALTINRAVSHAGAVPAAAGNNLGFAVYGGAIGDRVPVRVMGTAVAEAGAAIAANALVELDSSGRVVTKSAGVTVGRLAPGSVASAAGYQVEVILIPN